MADKKLVEKWIGKGDEDFGFASASLDEELEFFAQICFHFHQAAEKYLKAYLVKYDLGLKKIHDLLELLEECSSHNADLKKLKEYCLILNRFYIDTRYPVHWSATYTEVEADKAREAAAEIGKEIKKHVREK